MMHALVNLPRLHKQIIAGIVDAIFLPLAFILAILTRYETINFELISHYAWLISAVRFLSRSVYIAQ